MGQHVQCLAVAGAWVAYFMGQALDGLDVLGKDFKAGIDYRLDGAQFTVKIRGQGFYHHLRGTRFNRADAGCVVRRTTIIQIITVNRGEYDVAQGHQLDRFCGVFRLFLVQPAVRVAGIYRAEAAGAGTDRAHQHDGGGAVRPALAHVGAMGFLADGAQTVFADVALDRFKAISAGCLDAQPLGFGAEYLGLGVVTALLAVLDGGNALGVTELLAAGNRLLRTVGHGGQDSW